MTPGDLLVLASERPIRFSASALKSASNNQALRGWESEVSFKHPTALLKRNFLMSERALRKYFAGETETDQHGRSSAARVQSPEN